MKRLCSLTLAATLLLGLLVGCGETAASQPAVESEQQSVATAAPEQPEVVSQAEPQESIAESTLEDDWDPSLPYGNGTEEDWDPEAIVAAVDTSANPIQFPLDEQEELSVWMSIPDMLPQDLPEGMAAHRTFMAMEDLTNVKLDWT